MLHSYSCVSRIVITFFPPSFSPFFFFFSYTEISFKFFLGARGLMTACFHTEIFNQRLIRSRDTFNSADLIFHVPFRRPASIKSPAKARSERFLVTERSEDARVSCSDSRTIMWERKSNLFLCLRFQFKVVRSQTLTSGHWWLGLGRVSRIENRESIGTRTVFPILP